MNTSPQNPKTKSFVEHATASGIPTGEADFLSYMPSILAAALHEQAGLTAHHLEADLPFKGHRKMLEHISRSIGFPNWHAFTQVCKAMEDEDTPFERIESLRESVIGALPLLCEVKEDLPPSPDARKAIALLGAAIAKETGVSKIQVIDSLARMYDADDFERLCSRLPEETRAPLFAFEVDHEGHGSFGFSSACDALFERLDALYDKYDEDDDEQASAAEDELVDLLIKQPQFFPALHALSIYTNQGMPNFDEHLDAALDVVESLVPANFKGQISWYETNNRPYHRLLYAVMMGMVFTGQHKNALHWAKLQLKQNKSDNLGVRSWLPVLLLCAGKEKQAVLALKKMGKEEELFADGHMIAAGVHWHTGSREKSITAMLKALFDLPVLRAFIWENVYVGPMPITEPRPVDMRLTRGCIPDMETMQEQFWCLESPGTLGCTFGIGMIQLMKHPEVAAAEQELENLWISRIAANGSGMVDIAMWHRWKQRRTEMAEVLGRKLVNMDLTLPPEVEDPHEERKQEQLETEEQRAAKWQSFAPTWPELMSPAAAREAKSEAENKKKSRQVAATTDPQAPEPTSDLRTHGAYWTAVAAEGLAPVRHLPLTGRIFVHIEVEGRVFQAVALKSGLFLISKSRQRLGYDESASLGISSINHLSDDDGLSPSSKGWAVCKYMDQHHINLNGMSLAGLRRLAFEMGMPIHAHAASAAVAHGDASAMFEQSRAWDALMDWSVHHPSMVNAKNQKSGDYVACWVERAREHISAAKSAKSAASPD